MVELSDLEPKAQVRGRAQPQTQEINKEELLLQQMAESVPDEVVESDLFESDIAKEMGYEKVDERHKLSSYRVRPGRVVMFKVDKETGRVYRRIVPSKNMMMNHRNGWLMTCPECHTDCSPNPNECPTRVAKGEFKLNTTCPVCHKIFYDSGPLPTAKNDQTDPGSVDFNDFEDSATGRLKSLRDDHIRGVHPTVGRRMGLFAAIANEK